MNARLHCKAHLILIEVVLGFSVRSLVSKDSQRFTCIPYFHGEQYLFYLYKVTPATSQHATMIFLSSITQDIRLNKLSLLFIYISPYLFISKPPINTEKYPTCLPASCFHGNGPTGWHCVLTGAPSSRHPIVNTEDSRESDRS